FPVLGPGGVVPGLKAGAVSTGLLVGISAGVKTVVTDSSTPPPKPPPPTIAYDPSESFPRSPGDVLVAFASDGNFGVNNDQRIISTGFYSGGSISEVTSVVPEPSPMLLISTGLWSLWFVSFKE